MIWIASQWAQVTAGLASLSSASSDDFFLADQQAAIIARTEELGSLSRIVVVTIVKWKKWNREPDKFENVSTSRTSLYARAHVPFSRRATKKKTRSLRGTIIDFSFVFRVYPPPARSSNNTTTTRDLTNSIVRVYNTSTSNNSNNDSTSTFRTRFSSKEQSKAATQQS
jgi:hypothetical protein